jgi:Cu/Zn superoxide dismutase
VDEHEEDTPVAKKGHTEEQILRALRQAEGGIRVAEICRAVAEIRGRSIMVHTGGDNYSDTPAPLGGGGARIACGVIK